MIATPLTSLEQLSDDGPIYIYGCGVAGRRLYRALSLVAKLEIAGFVDSFQSGSLLGRPILNLQQFRQLDHAAISLVIGSSFFKPIFEAVADLPLRRCFDARPIIRAFPHTIGGLDDTMSDEAFQALFDWVMRESTMQRALLNPEGSYQARLKFDAIDRPHYGTVMLSAARLCHALGQSTVSAIEFGVAGGNGLVAMEEHAAEIEKIVPIKFSIFGFDTGTGMPPSTDYRDVLFDWRPGDFKMDQDALRRRLDRAELVIGDIGEKLGSFFGDYEVPPIGCCVVDVDYYSSTVAALKCFGHGSRHYLPRVSCYFDDILDEAIGQLVAIREFNGQSPRRQLARDLELGFTRPVPARWNQQIYTFHDFDHPLYNTPLAAEGKELPLF
jgi:hypothetical protein